MRTKRKVFKHQSLSSNIQTLYNMGQLFAKNVLIDPWYQSITIRCALQIAKFTSQITYRCRGVSSSKESSLQVNIFTQTFLHLVIKFVHFWTLKKNMVNVGLRSRDRVPLTCATTEGKARILCRILKLTSLILLILHLSRLCLKFSSKIPKVQVVEV